MVLLEHSKTWREGCISVSIYDKTMTLMTKCLTLGHIIFFYFEAHEKVNTPFSKVKAYYCNRFCMSGRVRQGCFGRKWQITENRKQCILLCKHSVFWVNLNLLTIFRIWALCYAYNKLKIIESVAVVIS